MRKILKFFVMAIIILAFGSCQKDELNVRQPADEVQPQEVVKPDVYVENGYLVFKSQEKFDSTLAVVQNLGDDDFNKWENSLGFISANTFYLEAEDEFSAVETGEQKKNFIEKYSKHLKISEGFDEIDLKFYAKSMGDVLNVDGEVKIGTSLYLFTEEKEYVILDGDKNVLVNLKNGAPNEKSANKNIVEFDPFKNSHLKSATGHEFLSGGNIYTDHYNKRLDYTLERTLFTYIHSFNPNTGLTNYSCGYKLFLRLKQYDKKRRGWTSDRTTYWVQGQSLHWSGLIDVKVVQTYNGSFPYKSFYHTKRTVYVYYADQYFLTTNPNVSDLIIYNYTSTFRSHRMHADGHPSDIFYKTITYHD